MVQISAYNTNLNIIANFVYFCIILGNLHHFRLKSGANFCASYKSIQNLLGYIFPILQHFATKLCNFTNFKMLFLAVVMDFVLLA